MIDKFGIEFRICPNISFPFSNHFTLNLLMLIFFLILSIAIFLLYSLLIIYYRFLFTQIKEVTYDSDEILTTAVTIVIPARNEEANIEQCIQSILQNNYPSHLLEIVVVDDFSEDNTTTIVQNYISQNLNLISLKDFINEKINSYKKKAIEIGIAHSVNELIITTDADCVVPKDWLQTIALFYKKNNAAFIAAPVLINAKNKFIQIFQALDFMTLQGITAAVVSKNQMTMCNGANMAYTRAAYQAVGGFAGIDNIASGDDMLLMHKIYKAFPDKVFFLKSKNVIVKTAAVENIKAFFNQRIRWASKAEKYEDKRILPVLFLVYFFNVIMLVMPIITGVASSTNVLIIWIVMLLLKTVIELFFLFPVAIFFNQKKILWYFTLMQPFHVCYTIIAGWLGKFGKYTWKERRVK